LKFGQLLSSESSSRAEFTDSSMSETVSHEFGGKNTCIRIFVKRY